MDVQLIEYQKAIKSHNSDSNFSSEKLLQNEGAVNSEVNLDEKVDYAKESWKGERKSICLTIVFNIEIILYNIFLIAFALRLMRYDEKSDQILVYTFPSLKAFFIWLNIEFTFRYFKTAKTMRHVFHSDPF